MRLLQYQRENKENHEMHVRWDTHHFYCGRCWTLCIHPKKTFLRSKKAQLHQTNFSAKSKSKVQGIAFIFVLSHFRSFIFPKVALLSGKLSTLLAFMAKRHNGKSIERSPWDQGQGSQFLFNKDYFNDIGLSKKKGPFAFSLQNGGEAIN